MCGFDGARRGTFWGRALNKTELETRMKTLKNGKAASMDDEVTDELFKRSGKVAVDRVWNLCSMFF